VRAALKGKRVYPLAVTRRKALREGSFQTLRQRFIEESVRQVPPDIALQKTTTNRACQDRLELGP